jgi:ABC-type transporter Mla MlaB component
MHNHRFPGAVFALLLAGTIALTGCGTTGAYNAATVTNVELSEDNYEVVATNVRGSAQAGYILGASFAASRQQRTLALVRVAGSGELYGEALNNLWASFEAEHGETDGRELALTNVRTDTDALNLLLYTRPRVTIRADVIQFTD